jgi:hypothetical protein
MLLKKDAVTRVTLASGLKSSFFETGSISATALSYLTPQILDGVLYLTPK